MAATRKDSLKIKNECKLCGEWDGKWQGENKTICKKGKKVSCYRQKKKITCPDYRKPSVIEAAKMLMDLVERS